MIIYSEIETGCIYSFDIQYSFCTKYLVASTSPHMLQNNFYEKIFLLVQKNALLGPYIT